MDFNHFIIGEKYNISALAIDGSFAGEKYAVFKLSTGRSIILRAEDLEAVSPARQDARSEHSTVGTLSAAERLDRLWNGMWDVLFGEASLRYAADDFKAMRNHIKSITPDTANGIKNTETATKYDPNRIFRKGDIVEMDTHGRNFSKELKKHGLKLCVRYTVTKDESADGHVAYTGDDGVEHLSMFFWLKLVTPVEELEPFYVERQGEKTGGLCYTVRKHGGYVESTFYFGDCRSRDEQHAKAAAEAERDRLNAEHRKEQE